MSSRFSLRRSRVLLATMLTLACGAQALGTERYESLPASKAQARANDPILTAEGFSDSQPSDIAAAMAALAACSERRAAIGVSNPCELIRLNNEQLRDAADIRARLPSEAHPLFLWRVEGESSTVYLAGSVHALKASLYPLPAPFEQAFQHSNTLVVEVDTVSADAGAMQRSVLDYALLPAGTTLDEVIEPATLSTLNRYLSTQAIPPASVAMLKPVMIATQLSVARLMALGYLPDRGVEQHFIGRAGTRSIVELESIDAQLELLTSPPFELQEQLLLDTLAQLPDTDEMISGLIVAWLSGDADELRRLFDEQSAQSAAYKAFMDKLLGQRNVSMAGRIEEFLERPGTYFVLVGAAHLTGSDGIVALLEQRNHRPVQIYSDETL